MKTLRSSELLMSVPEENRNPDWIKGALQEAIEIEFSSVQFVQRIPEGAITAEARQRYVQSGL